MENSCLFTIRDTVVKLGDYGFVYPQVFFGNRWWYVDLLGNFTDNIREGYCSSGINYEYKSFVLALKKIYPRLGYHEV